MNNRYHARINAFSLSESQQNAIEKAESLGLKIRPENHNASTEELNRFGNRYVEIFGDKAHCYIFGLAHPFDADNWYSIKYLPISEAILIDYFYSICYGLEQAIGSVMLEVKDHGHTFSDIKVTQNSAKFYVGDELFVVIEKASFHHGPKDAEREITSALKGVNSLYDETELTTQAIHDRLKKVQHFDNFKGYEVSRYGGLYLHSSISNFIRGFRFILSEITDDKVPLNVAEKVMWAFFGIDNEHVLRANEKSGCITGSLFLTEVYDEDSGLYQHTQNHISLPSALSTFQRKLVDLKLTHQSFHISPQGFGSWIYLPFGESMSLTIRAFHVFTSDYAELCADEAKKLFSGEVAFSSRKDFFIETFSINDVEIKLFEIDGELHTVDNCNAMVPLSSLLLHTTPKPWTVEANYTGVPYERPDPSSVPIEWHISRKKYGKPTTSLFRLGTLSLEDVDHIVSKLKIKAKSSLSHTDMETCVALSKINHKYNIVEQIF